MRKGMDAMVCRAHWLVVGAALTLAGCAGTIKQDARVQGDVSRIEGVAAVQVQMSPDASKQLADNAQFNRDELAAYLRRRLEGKGLIAPGATHKVDIVVTDIRVRSAFSAVMFGVLAGDDHVVGRVRVLDTAGRPLRSFEVNANYALGGWGGGQDGTRLGWLYDKFSELAAAELEKVIGAPRAAAAVPAQPPGGASASPPLAAAAIAPVPTSGPAVANSTPIDNIDAVPVSERGRNVYREWLAHKPPRAFVVSDAGHWYGLWGTKPVDPMEPADPSERGLKRCRDAGRSGCAVYAVDDRVVYVRPSPAQ
jgi:Domain of unknown function (DUF4410)